MPRLSRDVAGLPTVRFSVEGRGIFLGPDFWEKAFCDGHVNGNGKSRFSSNATAVLHSDDLPHLIVGIAVNGIFQTLAVHLERFQLGLRSKVRKEPWTPLNCFF